LYFNLGIRVFLISSLIVKFEIIGRGISIKGNWAFCGHSKYVGEELVGSFIGIFEPFKGTIVG